MAWRAAGCAGLVVVCTGVSLPQEREFDRKDNTGVSAVGLYTTPQGLDISLRECRKRCLKESACKGFTFEESTCWMRDKLELPGVEKLGSSLYTKNDDCDDKKDYWEFVEVRSLVPLLSFANPSQYVPSKWERNWVASIEMRKHDVCEALNKETADVDDWVATSKANMDHPPTGGPLNEDIYSKHVYKTASGETKALYLEPLVGNLRHPLACRYPSPLDQDGDGQSDGALTRLWSQRRPSRQKPSASASTSTGVHTDLSLPLQVQALGLRRPGVLARAVQEAFQLPGEQGLALP
jgi:hypothetical protein